MCHLNITEITTVCRSKYSKIVLGEKTSWYVVQNMQEYSTSFKIRQNIIFVEKKLILRYRPKYSLFQKKMYIVSSQKTPYCSISVVNSILRSLKKRYCSTLYSGMPSKKLLIMVRHQKKRHTVKKMSLCRKSALPRCDVKNITVVKNVVKNKHYLKVL